MFLLLSSLPALAIPPTTDVPLDEEKSVNRICDTNFISSKSMHYYYDCYRITKMNYDKKLEEENMSSTFEMVSKI